MRWGDEEEVSQISRGESTRHDDELRRAVA